MLPPPSSAAQRAAPQAHAPLPRRLGPFAPQLKKGDGALGGTWDTDGGGGGGGFNDGPSSIFDGGGGGGGGGGGSGGGGYGGGGGGGGYQPQTSYPAAGAFEAPPGAAEARAALSRRR